ncbi:MAG: hypothetical protein KJ964_13720 [Verrucomicrobia bacterium]|nr:hypothetical protein [Verrucomicrobiota bacterium]MBU1734658.1 hypothetical protein [Verrucomicrobiota bacterium]MBU1858154.1 hypothetical protein [Verrucomicrobiota bacterium]
MKTIDALTRLAELCAPVFTTNDAAAALQLTRPHASKTLARLAMARQVLRLRRGYWGFPDKIDPLMLPAILTAPAPGYISLQSALYSYGMISQVPKRIYAVSSARTQTFSTSLGAISVHHVKPSFFGGFEVNVRTGIAMATPEKALVDFLYLGPARSRLFAALPELELPKGFRRPLAFKFTRLIDSSCRRKVVSERLDELLNSKRSN